MKKITTIALFLTFGLFATDAVAQNNPQSGETKTTTVTPTTGTKTETIKPNTNKQNENNSGTKTNNGTSNKMAVNEEGVTEEKQGTKNTTTNTKITPK
jgi:hypothetical protein